MASKATFVLKLIGRGKCPGCDKVGKVFRVPGWVLCSDCVGLCKLPKRRETSVDLAGAGGAIGRSVSGAEGAGAC
jgi:hypothetical protein